MSDRRLLVFPAWTDNPFIGILYLASISRGTGFTGVKELGELYDELAEIGDGDVLHLHWTSPVCQSAPDEQTAREQLDAFITAVDGFRERGGQLIWTVHNALPHELQFRDLELRLVRHLADAADAVHVMAPSTPDIVAADYTLDPARVVTIPHPSYQGLHVRRDGDRERARSLLGIPEGRRVVLFFGRMRPYKGLDQLFDALALMVTRGEEPPVLLLAGPTPEGVEDEVTAALPAGVEVVREHGYIADEDLATWFAAADLAIFPFRAVLNSGSIHLAVTLGVPVLVPGEAHVRETFEGEEWLRYFDPADPVTSMADLLRDEATFERPVAAMRSFCDRRSPWTISRQMADVIDAL